MQQWARSTKAGLIAHIYFLVEEAYTQQGRAHIRRLHPDEAARPALMRRAHIIFILGWVVVVVVGGAYTQQGRAHSRRLHPDEAARPAHRKSKAKQWSASKPPSAHALAWAALWNSSKAKQ
jgi:hypothetical protein